MNSKSAFMSSLKKREDYEEAIQFIESEFNSGTNISTDKRNQFLIIICGTNSSIVGDCVKMQMNYCDPAYDDNTFDEIISNFYDYFLSEFSEITNQLLEFRKTNQNAAENFLEWLLYYKIKEIYTKNNMDKYLDACLIGNSYDKNEDGLLIDICSYNQYLSSYETLVPDSFEKDKRERMNNPMIFCQKHVVELALTLILEKMQQENWRRKIQSKIPGMQMYPYLVKNILDIDLTNEEVFQELLENVLEFITQKHPAEIDFNASQYLSELHHYAQIRLDEKYQKYIRRAKNTRNFTKNRIESTRRMLELLADKWVSPLDKYDIEKLCGVETANAEKLISRYKRGELSDLYNIVNVYSEDKDI